MSRIEELQRTVNEHKARCYQLAFGGTRIVYPPIGELSDAAKSAIRAQMYPEIPDFDLYEEPYIHEDT